MPPLKVSISPNIFEWVLKTAPFDDISDNLRAHFFKWKNNEKQPTFNQILEFSKKTGIPLGYFFLESPPAEHLPLLNFRTLDSAQATAPSRELIETYYQMAAIQDWMRDYLLDLGNEKLPFTASCKNEKDAGKVAASIRNALNMDVDWYSKSQNQGDSFRFIRQCFESIGILVMKNGIVGQNTHRPLDVYEFRAFTLADDYAPLIFINSRDSEGGQLFSLLHEAAHIWLGTHSFYNDSYGAAFNTSPTETLCNAAAAEILVPQQVFIGKWNNSGLAVSQNVEKLAKYFKCGKAVIIRKALDNYFITRGQYKELTDAIAASFSAVKAKAKGGNYYDTMASRYSKQFILALADSVQEGRTLFKDARRLTGTNRETFAKFADEVRGRLNAK
ncbi:MAG: ImmA/IrrE family metallo-endopeptidase [Spirochaetes bacterium]|nr:ImmA/IrrE family metallo-endopeptidase [Spirochaetota bacterium]